jgi:predicted nucleic acid-binding protein
LNYDACVLYPSVVRDVLIRVAIEGTVRAHWSDRILDEVFRNLKKNRPDLDPAKLDRTGVSWRRHLRDANVTGYESIIDGLVLPDPDDRHVLAAAMRAGAQVIVTDNLKHFPAAFRARHRRRRTSQRGGVPVPTVSRGQCRRHAGTSDVHQCRIEWPARPLDVMDRWTLRRTYLARCRSHLLSWARGRIAGG